MAKPAPKKALQAKIKLQIPGAEATPQPPVGPALGQHGVNIMEFIKRFNAATASMKGTIIPVEISVYKDRSFDFITKSPPAAILLKKAANIAKGAANPLTEAVGTVTQEQVRQIAQTKMEDLNARDVEAAMRQIEGTARSMGVKIKD